MERTSRLVGMLGLADRGPLGSGIALHRGDAADEGIGDSPPPAFETRYLVGPEGPPRCGIIGGGSDCGGDAGRPGQPMGRKPTWSDGSLKSPALTTGRVGLVARAWLDELETRYGLNRGSRKLDKGCRRR